MARGTKDPEQRISDLQRERVRIAGERHGFEARREAAKAVLLAAPDRKRVAVAAEARGGEDGQVAKVQAEAEGAAAVIRDLESRIEGLQLAEREIGEEAQSIFDSDEGIKHFTAAAEAASREAEAARVDAEAACTALKMKWMEAESKWLALRIAHKSRGDDEHAPRQVPRPDFPPPIPTMSAHLHPWPGGIKPTDEAA
jgi:hypothetical protein